MIQIAITKLMGLLVIAAASLTDLRATQGPIDLLADQADTIVVAAGSQDIVTLGKYFTAQPNMQVRYTDHGRDESGTWRCP